MRKKSNQKKLMSIGEIAKKLGIHEQTIRKYEKDGLIKPYRSTKNTRYFNEGDALKIITAITLTQEFGLNRTGVGLIFNLAKSYNIKDEELLDFIEDSKVPATHNTKIK